VKTVSLDATHTALLMNGATRLLPLLTLCPLIYRGCLIPNPLEERSTLCQLSMQGHPINMELTYLTNLTSLR